MLCMGWRYPSSSLFKPSSRLYFFSKTLSPFFHHTHSFHPLNNLLHSLKTPNKFFPLINKATHLSSSSLSTIMSHETSSKPSPTQSARLRRKTHRHSPENQLRHSLDMCSKRSDLLEALRLYDDARAKEIPLSQHHYNVLLYLCSSSNEMGSDLGLKRGFEIFQQMGNDQIPPNEATFTSVARLAAAMEDPELAFDLVKKMLGFSINPKLRSYGPALFGFCNKGEVERAYEVDAHMVAAGVLAEEPEIAALLRISSDFGNGVRVYDYLHRLRGAVRRVSESTAEIVEGWFSSDLAAEIGEEEWDVGKVREGVVKRGGGWHGKGWLGKGTWRVMRSEMDERGVCSSCGERLVCIDIDPLETDNFMSKLAGLACKKEVKADFTRFQEWLARHGPFEAVVDGANVGIFDQKHFSFSQLNFVVQGVRRLSPSKKLPLIVLHSRRVKGGPADNPKNKKLLESWQKSGVLYSTPVGSNDDWYWLYAAVSSRCLVVTNDEMRDHLFELLGTSFFPQWKEKHQVRMRLTRDSPIFQMPPPYSIVIQESETGSWHIPTVNCGDTETTRQWVCATRTPITLSTQSHVHADQTKAHHTQGLSKAAFSKMVQ
ncbi:proteinaceous RNase P 1 [Tasmannia lanceolata]|uniref:proteinaceous RNase P 1 n=1 Tax=Tasmannia lanceolata TaxID=3420 RepID=UPI004062FBDD